MARTGMSRIGFPGVSIALIGLVAVAVAVGAAADTPEGSGAKATDRSTMEFFEKEVRPLLAERCQGCHGQAKSKGDLRLDSRSGAMAGGKTGPAVVPGKPDESLLVDAINYGDFYRMPPKSKLPDREIAILTRWVEIGAPWSQHDAARPASAPKQAFDLRERAKHWCFQPLQRQALPTVKDESWARTPIDRFILAALEDRGLSPASEADRRTLIRRLTFDLIGLPPTPAEVKAFVADQSPQAYETLVERLLASPHYGERWGRHWLDLVRFAETAGHEFDYDTLDAYRYRDYVVRAFNADLPYDRLVVEHVAGDLVDEPRRHPSQGFNESVLGTGFFLLGEGTHSPVDLLEDEAARIDNQIDVFSKTFLGLTVACARCHDHKFDAISTRDYYALYGYLQSSRHQHAFIDPPGRISARVTELRKIKVELKAALDRNPTLLPELGITHDFLVAWIGPSFRRSASECSPRRSASPGVERRPAEDAERPRRHSDAERRNEDKRSTVVFEDFNGPTFEGWDVAGDAFGQGPSGSDEFVVTTRGMVPVAEGQAHSGLVSDRLQGVLRSRTFLIEKPFIHYLASGKHGRINLVIDGFEKIKSPIYGGLPIDIDSDRPRWHAQDVRMWSGHRAYIEIADGATADYTASSTSYTPGDGFIAVDEIRFSDQRPTAEVPGRNDSDAPEPCRASVAEVVDLLARYREVESKIPAPTLALALMDGTAEDERVHIRGGTRTLGEVVPRRFLEAIAGPDQASPGSGSGRLELAERMVDPANPLVARVLVNRIWKHHFGDGIVRSTDDFGLMGESPSHPALLDFLASRFIADGWSIKRMHRLIVLSSTYRMQSLPIAESEQVDPSNRLLHRMNVRRLEAEAVRDAILAVSGRLDGTLYGPSVPPHLTDFMDGRGRPKSSGPLDGNGRRSLYLNVRRNFMDPMLLAFDFPVPFSTMGRRNVSNVPAQALTLLNDPFVIGQARLWADRVLADKAMTPRDRLGTLYLAAFGRPPSEAETAEGLAFLDEQGAVYGGSDDLRAWADLCHVLINVKEFIYIN